MREINIALFGMTVFSENKGCMALAYSFLDLLSEALGNRKAKVFIFTYTKYLTCAKDFNSMWQNLSITFHESSLRRKAVKNEMNRIISQADICFDSTEGDSFSDIYGIKRILIQTLKKIYVLRKCPLVLTPQTFGPYNSVIAKFLAYYVLKKSIVAYARDESSAILVKTLFRIDIKSSTDTAFALKPISVDFERKIGITIGVNVSGLLYSGGYTGKNQFGLTVDYKIYVSELIRTLLEKGCYNIYLIPHVICDDYDSCENDLKVCESLAKKYPACSVVKGLKLAGELKYVISQMDVFTGARMHSTIAAFSSGIPTIPFSYSKKFEGLYNSLDYPFVVDGKNLETYEAVEETLQLIETRDELKKSVIPSLKKAEEKLGVFRNGLKENLDRI